MGKGPGARRGISCQTVLAALREFAPPRFALERDPTGLQVGSADKSVERVLCCLDLTLAVAEEARDLGAGLIVSHHAVIFRPLRDLRTDRPRGRILKILLADDIAAYVPHTALDVAPGGLNDRLAAVVGLTGARFLDESGCDESVRVELGEIGELEQATMQVARELCEKAGASAVWTSGQTLVAVVSARRVKTLTPRLEAACGSRVCVSSLLAPAASRGIGRVGRFEARESARQLGERLRRELGAPAVRVAAVDPAAPLSRVAVLCGDGRGYLDAATFAGVDALVTGDIDHHSALEARARGLALIDVGHWASERWAGEILAEALASRLEGQAVEVLPSQVDTQPFIYV